MNESRMSHGVESRTSNMDDARSMVAAAAGVNTCVSHE